MLHHQPLPLLSLLLLLPLLAAAADRRKSQWKTPT
jgi:hypothetical protein